MLSCQQSCPAIQVYTASNLELALEAAARSFISQEVELQGNKVSAVIAMLYYYWLLLGYHI